MAAIFDSLTDRITQGSVALPTTGTIAFWFKPGWAHTDGQTHTFFQVRNSSTQYIVLEKFSDNSLNAGWVNTVNYRVGVASGSYSISSGSWQHIAITWTNGGTTTLYLGGSSIGTSGGLVAFTTSQVRNIGNYASAALSDVSFAGQIAHYSLWSRALTGPQITALQTKVPSHPDAGATGTDWITLIDANTTNQWTGAAATLSGVTGSADAPTLIAAPSSYSFRSRNRQTRGGR
jgi:hypothetical protein